MAEVLHVRGRILGSESASDLVIADGHVQRISRAASGPCGVGDADAIIAPGLFDIQVNGANGIDLQSKTLRVEDVAELNNFLLRQGVTQWAPTLITGPLAAMKRGCAVLAEAMSDRSLARHIPGIHLEGPFISPHDGPRGAHPKRHVRIPNLREFDQLLAAAGGKVLYTTVAPDGPRAIPFIRGIVKRGVRVSLGHHNGSAETIAAAIDAGATLSTHLGNGLAPTIHRHLNPLWPQLADDRLTASLIADMHHLTPAMLRTFLRAKGPERSILVSDCMSIAGLKPGAYTVAGQAVELTRDRRINLLGTQLLAGSALMLLEGVVNAVHFGGLLMEDAIACATSVPARVLGLKRKFPVPAEGRKAEFIVFSIATRKRGPVPRVHAVFANGRRLV